VPRACLGDGHGVGRRRRLESHGEEDHLFGRMLPGDTQSVQRRIHDAHVAAASLDGEKVVGRAGDSEHIAERAKMTSGCAAISTALSINSMGVTHTGQPGPCTSVRDSGSRVSTPYFTIVWVWPPQISMIVQGRVTCRRWRARTARDLRIPVLVHEFHSALSAALFASSICFKYIKTSLASASSRRLIAMPTWTMT